MAYSFKKLIDVSTTTLQNGDTVILNQGNSIKQVNASQVGTVVEANPSPVGESFITGIKINTTSYKVPSVNASTTPLSTENTLKGLTVNDVDYKIASGLPEEATAGDAMIFNGTEWTKQSGYGYITAVEIFSQSNWEFESMGSGLRWLYGGSFYNTALEALLSEDHLGEHVKVTINGITTDYIVNINGSNYYCIGENSSSPVEGQFYMNKDEDGLNPQYASSASTVTLSVQIAQQYIKPIEPKLISEDGYGYTTPYSLSWDGATEGKTTIDDTWYQISDTYLPVDGVVGGTVSAILSGSSVTQTITSSDISEISGGWAIVYTMSDSNYTVGIIISSDGSLVYLSTTVDEGVWFFRGDDTNYVTNLSATEIHKIDSKYLSSNEIPTISIASSQISPETTGFPMEVNLTEEQLELLTSNKYSTYFCDLAGAKSAYFTKGAVNLSKNELNGGRTDIYLETFMGNSDRTVLQAGVEIDNSKLVVYEVEVATKESIPSTYQAKLTAGTNITIVDNVISVPNIPTAPTTAGTYTLQCVIDDSGNATYSWVLQS